MPGGINRIGDQTIDPTTQHGVISDLTIMHEEVLPKDKGMAIGGSHLARCRRPHMAKNRGASICWQSEVRLGSAQAGMIER